VFLEPLGGDRPSNQVTLQLIASLLLQQAEMGLGLDPFRNHPQTQCMPHRDDGGRDRRIVRVSGDFPDE
jgi:hypothetical protein